MKISKEELITKLNELAKETEKDSIKAVDNHRYADELLLDFIGDKKVKKAFNSIERWYE